MKNIFSTVALIWRLAIPYFRSEDRWAGRILLASIVAIELGLVAIDVLINYWNARFFNAIQEYNWDAFVYELGYFCVLAAIFLVLAVYQLYLNQWLQIRWRRYMTERYLDGWLAAGNHYRMQLMGDAADNPDQRIAEDIQKFVEQTLAISLRLLSSIVTLASFVVILWSLSSQAPLQLFGVNVAIPGYLVWAALIYAILGTWLAHLIGRPLIGLYFNQQRYEADFRFNLVRVRENSEQIALLSGDRAERGRLLDRFAAVMTNWYGIMTQTKRLTAFTAGYQQISVIFPYIVVAPAYFAKTIPLGVLTQTASAFSSVQSALSFFVTAYRTIAEWRSVVARLDGFQTAVEAARAAAVTPPIIKSEPAADNRVTLRKVAARLPGGQPLVEADGVAVGQRDRVLVNGPSGAGKSTLFRAIAGIWPFGSGTVSVPSEAKLMVLPQRPYLPIGTLHAAIVYPALSEAFDRQQVSDVLTAVGLPALAARLDEVEHWNRMLSLGEQQRLAIARALLHKPDYLLLDEATASLDEASEAKLYELLDDRLPNAAIVSIGHRSTLRGFHTRHLELVRDTGVFSVRETAMPRAT